MKKILRVENVSKEFVGVKALNNVSFSCYPGKVHVLQGENGAGKSTILKIITGIYKPNTGKVIFNDVDITGKHPDEIRKAGIAMVYQELTVLPELTVAQNIFLNSEKNILGKNLFLREKVLLQKAEELMEVYGIKENAYARVGDLPVARQQMIEILKALAMDPKVLILDEPTSALAFAEVRQLREIVSRILEKGTSVIFISHRMDEVFQFGDQITVLKDGCVVDTVNAKDVTGDDVIRMMVGRELTGIFPRKAENAAGEEIFRVENLSVGKTVTNVSLEVKRNEILGIAALQGQGQTEFMEAAAGIRKKTSGTIYLYGKKLQVSYPYQGISNGIVYVPDDRKQQGLCLELNIRENLAMESLKKRSKGGVICKKKERETIDKMIQVMNIKTPTSAQYVDRLSGGNQQKVVIGKVLSAEPKVIFFNEPTRGIDVEAKQEIYRLIRELTSSGTAVILYSSDILEIVGMCDRVLTMFEGRITSTLTGENIEEETIMRGVTGKEEGGTIHA